MQNKRQVGQSFLTKKLTQTSICLQFSVVEDTAAIIKLYEKAREVSKLRKPAAYIATQAGIIDHNLFLNGNLYDI